MPNAGLDHPPPQGAPKVATQAANRTHGHSHSQNLLQVALGAASMRKPSSKTSLQTLRQTDASPTGLDHAPYSQASPNTPPHRRPMLHRAALLGAASTSMRRGGALPPTAALRLPLRAISGSASSAKPAAAAEDMGEPVADSPGFEFGKIGLLGGGRMAEAILAGVVKEELLDPSKIVVYDVNRERLDYLKKTFGVTPASSVAATCNTDLTVICVKPQNLPGVWGSLRKHLKPQSVLLSIVAGVPVHDFVELSGATRVVRTMPNTPATIQKGMTVWCCSDDVSKAQRDSVAKFLSSLGEQHYVNDEQYLDMATAVSGSGPGYVLVILEALIDGAVHLGFSREVASKLVLQTVYGTTAMAMKTGLHPAILRNSVTSPAGTTASALYVLEKGRFRTVLADALWSAYRRSLELGNMDSNVGPGRSKHEPKE